MALMQAILEDVPPDEVRKQLDRILASTSFASSRRMSRFLRFTLLEVLAGRADWLKESLIGVEVFDRDPAYDPRLDSIVRVEARRLRAKLRDYYLGAGRHDPVVVELPVGHYVPCVRRNRSAGAATAMHGTALVLVRPFACLGGGDESFGLGVTQEIVHALMQVAGVRVISSNGPAPGSSFEVEGNVRRQGDRVRIWARILHHPEGLYVWSESWDRQLHDPFVMQEQVALELARVFESLGGGTSLSRAEPPG
jgi:serine/threonine-protein kinase